MTLNNNQYLKAIEVGDHKGLEQIYREFAPAVLKLVTSNGGSKEDARDVFQSALIVVYQRMKEDKLTLSGSFGGLLYGISRNIWGNRLQKKSFKEVSIPEEAKYTLEETWQDEIEEEEKRKLLRDKMKQLGVQCRQLLELFFANISMEEIRQHLGFGSVSYAMKRKFICKEKLVNLIKEDPRYKELKY